jgi:hypothetical protein
MTSAGSRAVYGLSVLTLIAAGIAMAATPDRMGVTLLFTAGLVSVLLALLLGQAGGPADAGAVQGRSASTDTPAPSAAPIFGALAGGVAVLGLALGMLAYAGAALLALYAAFLWLSGAHRSSSRHVNAVSDRVSERLTMPVGIPVLAAGLIAVIAISISRILLASTKNGAVAVAGVVAIVFLVGGSLAAARPRSSRQQFRTVAVLALLAVVALGVAGVVRGETPIKHHGESSGEGKAGEGKAGDAGHSSDGEAKPAEEGESHSE